MAYFFLEEKMTKNTLIGLFFAFCGAIVLILGGENDDPVPQGSSLIGFICLIMNPVFVAIGTIMMRKMKKLNESVVSCYMNATTIIVFAPIVYA